MQLYSQAGNSGLRPQSGSDERRLVGFVKKKTALEARVKAGPNSPYNNYYNPLDCTGS
jgi:hypothetical protein